MIVKYKTLNFFTIWCVALYMIFVSFGVFAQAPGSSIFSNDVLFENTNVITTDVCPEPRSALSNTPNDLAKIQSDITRFSLCVKRAQLLERLNELVSSSIETIDSAIEYNISPLMDNLTTDIMQNIPVPQAPLLSDAGEHKNTSLANIVSVQQNLWRVREISGKNGALNATLISDEGVIVNVKQGEKSPDGAGVVSSLSVAGVKIKKDGKITTLKWVE